MTKIIMFLEPYKGQVVPIGRLQRLIMENIGSTERTLEESLKTMIQFELVREVESFQFLVI